MHNIDTQRFAITGYPYCAYIQRFLLIQISKILQYRYPEIPINANIWVAILCRALDICINKNLRISVYHRYPENLLMQIIGYLHVENFRDLY